MYRVRTGSAPIWRIDYSIVIAADERGRHGWVILDAGYGWPMVAGIIVWAGAKPVPPEIRTVEHLILCQDLERQQSRDQD